ncbi:hypothetical protein LOK49_LG12G02314 [Camellia lanceoleosa]|uniref:Uncharacterized protein n=1 Tax=Camellia lanceoleosa TaxID=1840588 RepID=A0ACC0FYK1_9ERIC|nr:hypothetical protein LOK49_LG12G02314 [Camellia lanceoleosa]
MADPCMPFDAWLLLMDLAIKRSSDDPPTTNLPFGTMTMCSHLTGDVYEKRAAKLKEDVKIMLEKVVDEDPLDALEMIDDLQRLGVFNHFKDEIERNELQRGVVPKSIQCYMHETGASENDAREHMKYLIGETWKKMNEDGAANSLFTKDFIGIAMNLAGMSQCMYQYGDGHGAPGKGTKYRVLSLVVNPVPLL